MLSVTNRARDELKRMLADKVDNPQAGLRLTTNDSGQLGLTIDIETPDDQVVEHDGSKVLLVKNTLADSLKEITIDVKDTPEGASLFIVKNSEK
jgi:Fe-S cluster assembly iron-binding protein IscA